MTYKEFEKWCEENGYKVSYNNEKVYIGKGILSLGSVYMGHRNCLGATSFEEVADDLFDKMIELAITPIEEREEPKKYYVKLVDREDGYINKTSSGELLLLNRSQRFNYQTKFTEKEIKEIDERYMAFAVEVEQ